MVANNDLNPAKNWDYVTGLVGFAYETPFRYDPLKDRFILARDEREMDLEEHVRHDDSPRRDLE